MTPEELIAKYSVFQNLECGAYIPPGWVGILEKFAQEVEGRSVVLSQVKQKLGGLRIYLANGSARDPEVNVAITFAMAEATDTCENCGAKGAKKVGIGKDPCVYWTTRCLAHRNAR